MGIAFLLGLTCLLTVPVFAKDDFTDAKLIFGMNSGYNDRLPVLIIPDEGPFAGCMLQGEAGADFVLQRIEVKLSRATCANKKEARIYEIDAYVFDRDGKPGIMALVKKPSKDVLAIIEKYEEVKRTILSEAGGNSAGAWKQFPDYEIIKQGYLTIEKDTPIKLFIKSNSLIDTKQIGVVY